MNRSTLVTGARTLGGITLVVAVALVVLLVAPQTIGAKASYAVLSGSMSPTIDAGDVVVVRDVAPETVSKGDIITYRESGSSITDERTDRVTHRVVAVDRSGDTPVFRTKGDANEEVDADPVRANELVGKVWFHVPYLGYFSQFSQSRLGLILFVILPGVLLVVSEIYSLYTDALVDPGEVDTDSADGESDDALTPEHTGVKLVERIGTVAHGTEPSHTDGGVEWSDDPQVSSETVEDRADATTAPGERDG
ncbi:signal peptidase I (plasmid) [Haloferax sp. S1W]|uniref:signal peptidase I n=1 Tax=Haloferax sp. S1W TaxID=3377110 RepID=UPI0037CB50F0